MRGLQTHSLHRGIGVLWRNMMRNLAIIDKNNQYYLFYAAGFPAADDFIEYPENFERIRVRIPFFRQKKSIPLMWFWDTHRLGSLAKSLSVDVLVYTTFAEIWFPDRKVRNIPTIAWIYDLIPFLFQEEYFKKIQYGLIKKILMTKKLKYALSYDAIITLSESCIPDILKFIPTNSGAVYYDYLGVDPSFFRIDEDLKDKAKFKFNLPDNYIFYIGGIDPRKNLIRLIKAYSVALQLIDLPPVIIVGNVDKTYRHYKGFIRTISERGLLDRFIFIGFVPDEYIPALYSMAEFLLFPSLYEGFGLPVLEAMAAGCPVLTSNLSSMPEIAGNCAVLVDPYNPDSIAQGIIELIKNAELRESLARCGRERARHFSWRKTAKRFLEIINEVVQNASRK